jgi:hypothetical protein
MLDTMTLLLLLTLGGLRMRNTIVSNLIGSVPTFLLSSRLLQALRMCSSVLSQLPLQPPHLQHTFNTQRRPLYRLPRKQHEILYTLLYVSQYHKHGACCSQPRTASRSAAGTEAGRRRPLQAGHRVPAPKAEQAANFRDYGLGDSRGCCS